ncbi:conserved repeat domain-containing protein/Por secretion system C-terminal sorting domain-containing protein [Arachidicoccus rhizosphaerae]|uniref:Conserved repeat domain-containing protein/Por secretion system C-terminal sorting domain-containing protein n=1 Tax=Arachidicoccus rhizosphaerae TaxID=551991 RepID=A0A1H3Z4V4_9BACT|nr:T9SS type A sorting domain-containing protein [Arachidicoccus rhizosphaerae]SEA18697.1 conserved repeat domain-containing protein/Por secretion system C-terminal sorting domain-containing protein [Arachidicoccus rhizosphaerae]
MKRKFTTTKKTPNYGRILAWIMGLAMLLTFLNAHAQFTIKQDFKGSNINNDIILGGDPSSAYLTSGKEDPINSGWLRVTKADYQQKGFAYINKSFPSSLGVFIDFEYSAWADSKAQYGSADGFSVFLFDAQYGPGTFKLGGNGGSLGYSYLKSGTTTQGLTGGYIGIGIDEYGNFSNPTEGRVGGPGFTPNAIVLRGPTTKDKETNKYLQGIQVSSPVAYNSIVKNRPSSNNFYRRIQIQVDPTADKKYRIQVRWATSVGGSFTKILDYTTTTAPPKNMKVGFAASTGLGYNYHEIRNLVVTTPGGVRLDKQVNKTSVAVGEQLKYTVKIGNATTADLQGLILTDTLRDGAGNILPQDFFAVDSIVFNNQGNTKNILKNTSFNSGTYKAEIDMGAATLDNSTEATVTSYITLKKRPEGGIISNAAYIDATGTGITDQDLTNNYAKVSTQIIATDLSVTTSKKGSFYQGDEKGQLLVQVKNNGPDATGTSTIITDTLPEGLELMSNEDNGWIVEEQNGVITAVYNGTVGSNQDFPPLILNVKTRDDASGAVENKGIVRVSTDNDTANNTFSDQLTIQQFSAGEIGSDQKIKEQQTPAAFTQIEAASTTTGATINHQWQISEDGVNWTDIQGATEATYQQTQSLASTTYYRRLDNATDRDLAPVASNIITVTVEDGTLAITLQNFSGYSSKGLNHLDWITSSEIDNKGFDIYRSTDNGKSWNKVGFIAGNGTTTQSSTYQFEEPIQISVNETQYKLQIIDNQGKFTWSKIVSIKSGANANVKLYPNPASDYIYISGVSGNAIIYDASGRQVLTQAIPSGSATRIYIQAIAKGIYFIKIGAVQLKFVKK